MNPFKTISDQEAEAFFRKVDNQTTSLIEEICILEKLLYDWRTHKRICRALDKDPEANMGDHTRDLLLMLKIVETEYQDRKEEEERRNKRRELMNGK